MTLINTRIISHPLNWLIILLMLVIAGIFGHLLLTVLDQEPSVKATTKSAPQGYSTSIVGLDQEDAYA
jgi:hypothetical protein